MQTFIKKNQGGQNYDTHLFLTKMRQTTFCMTLKSVTHIQVKKLLFHWDNMTAYLYLLISNIKKRIMLKAIICPTCVQSPKIYKLIYSKPYMTEDYSPITYEAQVMGIGVAGKFCFTNNFIVFVQNDENNPQFDENKLVFRCFTLQDRKK